MIFFDPIWSYPKSRWVDCYCKPDGVHTIWISTISTLAFIFVLLKFGSYFLHKYKKYRHKKKVSYKFFRGQPLGSLEDQSSVGRLRLNWNNLYIIIYSIRYSLKATVWSYKKGFNIVQRLWLVIIKIVTWISVL